MSSAQFQKPVRLVVSIPTAATPVQVSTSPLFVRSFTIQAHFQNTDRVFVGDSSGNSSSANGHMLNPGDNFGIAGDTMNSRFVQFDLSDFWVSAAANSSKVIITYMAEVLHQ